MTCACCPRDDGDADATIELPAPAKRPRRVRARCLECGNNHMTQPAGWTPSITIPLRPRIQVGYCDRCVGADNLRSRGERTASARAWARLP